MYKVKRYGKKTPTTLSQAYESYDKARQAVRKWICKAVVSGKLDDNEVDAGNRTYSIGKYGFGVVKA